MNSLVCNEKLTDIRTRLAVFNHFYAKNGGERSQELEDLEYVLECLATAERQLEARPPQEATGRHPHWTCKTHGDFDARVAVGCPECVREMRARLSREPPQPAEASGIRPIEIGVGKVRVAICYDGDDPAKVLRELVIYDDGGEYQPVGTDLPEHRGKAVPDVGRILARLRISNADGAAVFVKDLQAVIEHARVADGGLPHEPVQLPFGMRVPAPGTKCDHGVLLEHECEACNSSTKAEPHG